MEENVHELHIKENFEQINSLNITYTMFINIKKHQKIKNLHL